MYGGSIEISGNVFYRSQTCVFLTIDDNNKVRLKLIHLPVYHDYGMTGCSIDMKNYWIQNLKPEFSVDFNQSN